MNHNPLNIDRRHLMQWAGATAALSALPAWAQSAWPTKPVTLVVPFPAGGGTDAFARPLSAQFSRLTGKQLIIDNRGGANLSTQGSLYNDDEHYSGFWLIKADTPKEAKALAFEGSLACNRKVELRPYLG